MIDADMAKANFQKLREVSYVDNESKKKKHRGGKARNERRKESKLKQLKSLSGQNKEKGGESGLK